MRRRHLRQDGFTLIELLVVIIIIGILAAIAIGQYRNTKEDALDASAKSDLRNMMTAQENYYSEFQAYTDATIAPLGTIDFDGDGAVDFSAGQGISIQSTGYTDGFQITSSHANSSNTWCINSSGSNASGSIGIILKATSC